jgi:hypothetical protein
MSGQWVELTLIRDGEQQKGLVNLAQARFIRNSPDRNRNNRSIIWFDDDSTVSVVESLELISRLVGGLAWIP